MLKSIIPVMATLGFALSAPSMPAHASSTSDYLDFDFYTTELQTQESRHQLERRISVEVSDYCRESIRKDGPGPKLQSKFRDCQSVMAQRVMDAVVERVAERGIIAMKSH